jgi:hypothetical protein
MKYYKVKETGAHAYHTIVDEKCDLSFFYNNKIDFKNSIEISYFTNDENHHKSKHVKYLELEKELKTQHVFMLQVIEKDFEIRFSGSELWVFSRSKEKAKKIYNLLELK